MVNKNDCEIVLVALRLACDELSIGAVGIALYGGPIASDVLNGHFISKAKRIVFKEENKN